MKLTFGSILNECNRLALEDGMREQSRSLKTKIVRLRTDYEKGIIDDATYAQREAEILRDLRDGGRAY